MSCAARILQMLDKMPEEKQNFCYSWLLEAKRNHCHAEEVHFDEVGEVLEDKEDVDLESNASTERLEHGSASEQSDECCVSEISTQEQYVGRDGTTFWNKNPPPRPNKNVSKKIIVFRLPGAKGSAKDENSVLGCWKLFFDNEILSEIVSNTNIMMRKIQSRLERPRDCYETNFEEITAFLGLIYIAGIKKAQHLNLDELWSDDGTSPECFRATMSAKRFALLCRAIRFDDIATRSERKKLDNLAPIRRVFEHFVARCKSNYELGQYTTIGEMLESFRGRCKFRVYVPNKPANYGIKMYALVDSRVYYTSNLEIYAGKQPPGPYFTDNRPESVANRLIQPIANTGRNVTMDNYFTSIPLANDLEKMRTTIVGMLKNNKREIPPEFLVLKGRPLKSAIFGYRNGLVLLSYKSKMNKNVLLYSSFHSQGNIDLDSGDSTMPEILSFYNLTKGGVDVVDELKSLYSVARISRRWPLRIFFSLLDIGGINSQVVFEANTSEKMLRRIFLKNLGLALIKPHLVRRSSISNLSIPLKMSINRLAGVENQPTKRERETSQDGFCGFCPRKKNRKTKKNCHKCNMPICTEHTYYTCTQCQQID